MNRTHLETRVKEIVAEAAKVDPSEIDTSRWLPDYGIDSLQLLVIRETIESAFSVHIPDGRWLDMDSLASLSSSTKPESMPTLAQPRRIRSR